MTTFAEHMADQAGITARYEALTKIGTLAHDLGAEIEVCEDVDAALAYCGEHQDGMDTLQLRTLDEARADAGEDAAETIDQLRAAVNAAFRTGYAAAVDGDDVDDAWEENADLHMREVLRAIG